MIACAACTLLPAQRTLHLPLADDCKLFQERCTAGNSCSIMQAVPSSCACSSCASRSQCLIPWACGPDSPSQATPLCILAGVIHVCRTSLPHVDRLRPLTLTHCWLMWLDAGAESRGVSAAAAPVPGRRGHRQAQHGHLRAAATSRCSCSLQAGHWRGPGCSGCQDGSCTLPCRPGVQEQRADMLT